MKRIFTFVFATAFLTACHDNRTFVPKTTSINTTIPINISVPYTIASGYFIKNTIPEDTIVSKVTTLEEFDQLFGAAPVMGEHGKPTVVDFSKEYIIPIINKTTDEAITLAIDSVNIQGENIAVSYKVTTGEKQSYTTRPVLLLKVANEYQGHIQLIGG